MKIYDFGIMSGDLANNLFESTTKYLCKKSLLIYTNMFIFVARN